MMVTWTTYLSVLFILLALYYAIIILLYYRNEIGSKIAGKKRNQAKKSVDSILFPEPVDEDENLDTESTTIYSLVDELQAFIYQAGREKMDKKTLVIGIKKLLKKYPRTKGSIYQEGISNMIAVITENNCGIYFSADELRNMWV
ncbi:hypothetical protein ACDQ55_15215 [Chitinophaga sp. 30R24]|uniref:hypothetical protein n=1 Tax=Chitinophaga sp. 30R24 TaxID=3248838 RepID=UPI003B90045C